MTEKTRLTNEERSLLTQKEFFILKKAVMHKLMELLGLLNEELKKYNAEYHSLLPDEIFNKSGKISKGENYLGFPWLVLDHPRIFKKEDVFAFRSMCWWGNEISFTLHLSGKYKSMLSSPETRLNNLTGKGYFININHTPWEYHFKENNYLSLEKVMQSDFNVHQHPFLKISRKISIDAAEDLVSEGSKTYAELIKTLFI
ncbi:MAG: hypothetical protein ABI772_06345 [Bacteroidota bacterium]